MKYGTTEVMRSAELNPAAAHARQHKDLGFVIPSGSNDGSDSTERAEVQAWNAWRVEWRGPSRRVRYDGRSASGRSMTQDDGQHPASTDHTVPSGTDHFPDFPGISCLATFIRSLWDQTHASLC